MVRAPAGREQLSVYRVLDRVNEGGRLVTRRVAADGGRWSVSVRDRAPGSGLLDVPLTRAAGRGRRRSHGGADLHHARRRSGSTARRSGATCTGPIWRRIPPIAAPW